MCICVDVYVFIIVYVYLCICVSMQMLMAHRTGMVALVFGLQPKEAAEMRTLFQSFDADCSGALSLPEFTTALSHVMPTLSEDDVRKIFRLIDIDGDEQISYTEFLAATLDPRWVIWVIWFVASKAHRMMDATQWWKQAIYQGSALFFSLTICSMILLPFNDVVNIFQRNRRGRAE